MDHRRRAIAARSLFLALTLTTTWLTTESSAAICLLTDDVLHVTLGDYEHVTFATDGTELTASGDCSFVGQVLGLSVTSTAPGIESAVFLDAASADWNFPIAISGVEDVELHGTEAAETLDARAFPFSLSGVTTLFIRGFGGSDVITAIPTLQIEAWAGEGDDQVFGSRRSDNVHGEAGSDTVWGERGADYILGSVGADTLYGDSGADILEGGDDDDLLYGGSGNDYIYGELGADTLFSGGGTDTLDGGDGSDACEGLGSNARRFAKITYEGCDVAT